MIPTNIKLIKNPGRLVLSNSVPLTAATINNTPVHCLTLPHFVNWINFGYAKRTNIQLYNSIKLAAVVMNSYTRSGINRPKIMLALNPPSVKRRANGATFNFFPFFEKIEGASPSSAE